MRELNRSLFVFIIILRSGGCILKLFQQLFFFFKVVCLCSKYYNTYQEDDLMHMDFDS